MSKNPKLPLYRDLARENGGWSGVVRAVPDRLTDIVALGRRKKPARVFVCDMSDLFHDAVPFRFIAAVFGAIACAPNMLFYVLTKRPVRAVEFHRWLEINGGPAHVLSDEMAAHHFDDDIAVAVCNYVSGWSRWRSMPDDGNPLNGTVQRWPLPNVAFGVTVEDRRYGVPRLDIARQFPARWHWASVEPQLEDLGDVDFGGFRLVVNGGEAHRSARPFRVEWARNVRDRARAAGAAYFFKQAGDHVLWDGIATPEAPGFPARTKMIDVMGAWRVDLGRKGNDLARMPVDLRIRENIPWLGA